MNELLFLSDNTNIHNKIWGREHWVISGMPGNESVIINGQFHGMPLTDLFELYPEFFGFKNEPSLPLLMKVIETQDNLSIQIHPHDAYAKAHGQVRGKNECWYILAAEEDASLLLEKPGLTKETFKYAMEYGAIGELTERVYVKVGDFITVPAGTIHAIGGGITLLEIQQASDTTYRIYDYERVDSDGVLRPLHLQEALDVFDAETSWTQSKPGNRQNFHISFTYEKNNEFIIEKKVINENRFYSDDCSFVYISKGSGFIDSVYVKAGRSFIIPVDVKEFHVHVSKQLEWIIVKIKQQK